MSKASSKPTIWGTRLINKTKTQRVITMPWKICLYVW